MKLGLGLYKHMLNKENYLFARQAGVTHIVAHLTDYFDKVLKSEGTNQPVGNVEQGWGYAEYSEIWSLESLISLRSEIESFGLKLEALENVSPHFWFDILLDGSNKQKQMEGMKKLIRNMGKARIPILGISFSLAGVAGRIEGNFARGGALAIGMNGESDILQRPIPLGMVWNMIYDEKAAPGELKPITQDEIIKRYNSFIREMIPVAEEWDVKLALHPDDPPMVIRSQPRLGYSPLDYIHIIKSLNSSSHVMELCLGTLSEMKQGDIYEAVDFFSKNDKIGYIHCRNVKGIVPNYKETFIDDGDIDMVKIIRILKRNKFKGVIIPDHTPRMSCSAPWHAGMAYAVGYIRGLLQSIS